MQKPIYIYWLLDVSPGTIAAGWHSGYPFYCGKALDPAKRLRQHICAARDGKDLKSSRIRKCGSDFVQMHVVETIPAGNPWQEKERRWIRLVRFCFPDNCNIADGGQGGLAGYEMTRTQRAELRAAVRASKRCQHARMKRRRKAREARAITVKTMCARIRAHKKKIKEQLTCK